MKLAASTFIKGWQSVSRHERKLESCLFFATTLLYSSEKVQLRMWLLLFLGAFFQLIIILDAKYSEGIINTGVKTLSVSFRFLHIFHWIGVLLIFYLNLHH